MEGMEEQWEPEEEQKEDEKEDGEQFLQQEKWKEELLRE